MIAAGTSEITKRAAPTRRRLTKRSIEAIPTPDSGRVAIFAVNAGFGGGILPPRASLSPPRGFTPRCLRLA